MAAHKVAEEHGASEALEALAKASLAVAKKARRHRQSLRGDNFYGNKLAELRADATNAFRQLASRSAGDSSALAELVEAAFSAETDRSRRAEAVRELTFALRTTWKVSAEPNTASPVEDIFPLTILTESKRGYFVTIGRQMNGSFRSGWFDSCAVMIRRLLEIVIIEAFEAKTLAAKITDGDGNYLQLSGLINAALAETSWTLSRNAKKLLAPAARCGSSISSRAPLPCTARRYRAAAAGLSCGTGRVPPSCGLAVTLCVSIVRPAV